MASVLGSVALTALLAGCAAPAPDLEPLPSVSMEGLGPVVADRLRPLVGTLESSPRDAEAAGNAGALLLAYDRNALAEPFLGRAEALAPAELKWAYYRGIALDRLGRHLESADCFERCIRIDGDFLPARIRLAEARLAASEIESSLERFRDLVVTAPDNAFVLYGAGRAEAAAGNSETARSHLARAVESAPGFAQAHYALGLLLRDQGDEAGAARHLEAFERNRNGVPPRDDPLHQSLMSLRVSAAQLLQQGVEAKRSGRTEAAIGLHLKALEEDPSLTQARVNLLILYGSRGRHEAAERQYQLGVDAGSATAELHYNYGVLAYGQGRVGQADTAFRKALDLNPDHALANHNVGQILEEQGRFDEAMARYQRALAIRPEHGLSHYKIGMMWMRRRNAPEAVRSFQEAAKEDSDRRPTYLFSLAAAQLASGNRERAIARFAEARRLAVERSQPELVARIDETLAKLGVPATP